MGLFYRINKIYGSLSSVVIHKMSEIEIFIGLFLEVESHISYCLL